MTYIALLYGLFIIAKWPFWMKKEGLFVKTPHHLTQHR